MPPPLKKRRFDDLPVRLNWGEGEHTYADDELPESLNWSDEPDLPARIDGRNPEGDAGVNEAPAYAPEIDDDTAPLPATDDTPANGDDRERPWYADVGRGAGAFVQGASLNLADNFARGFGANEAADWFDEVADEYPTAHSAGQLGTATGAALAAGPTLPAAIGSSMLVGGGSKIGDWESMSDPREWAEFAGSLGESAIAGVTGWAGGQLLGKGIGAMQSRRAAQVARREADGELAKQQMRALNQEPVLRDRAMFESEYPQQGYDPQQARGFRRPPANEALPPESPSDVVRGHEQYTSEYPEGPDPRLRSEPPRVPASFEAVDALDELAVPREFGALPPEPVPLLTPEDGPSLVRAKGRYAKPVPMELDTTTPPGYGPPGRPYTGDGDFLVEPSAEQVRAPLEGPLADPGYREPFGPPAEPPPLPQRTEVLQSFDPSQQPFRQAPSAAPAPVPGEATAPARPGVRRIQANGQEHFLAQNGAIMPAGQPDVVMGPDAQAIRRAELARDMPPLPPLPPQGPSPVSDPRRNALLGVPAPAAPPAPQARPPAMPDQRTDVLDELIAGQPPRPQPGPSSGPPPLPPRFAMNPVQPPTPGLNPDVVPNALAQEAEPPQLPLNALARGAGAAKDFLFGGPLGKARALGDGAQLLGDALNRGGGKYPISAPGYGVGYAAGRGLGDIGLPALTGSKVNAQGEDQVAYASAPTRTWAVQSVLASGNLAMKPQDEEALMTALASGDDQRVSAADYRLRQLYPRYARAVEKTLRDLNDEGE